MRGGFRALLLAVGFVLALGVVYLPRASDAQVGCDGCVVAAVTKASTAEMLNLRQALLGIVPAGIPYPVGYDDFRMPVMSPPVPVPFTSLVEYFERVWWPRFLGSSQSMVGNQQKFQTALGAQETRQKDAVAQVNYASDVNKIQTQNAAQVLLRPNVLCPPASMQQSSTAGDIITRNQEKLIEDDRSRKAAGSVRTPNYAKGPDVLAKNALANRVRYGTCMKDASSGTSEGYCPDGKEAVENADVKFTSLTKNWLLSDSTEVPASATFASMFIDNVFYYRLFRSLPKSVTTPGSNGALSPEVNNILAAQNAFESQMAVFASPYTEAQAERLPLTGGLSNCDPNLMAMGVCQSGGNSIQATATLKAAMDRAGLNGDLAKQLIDGDKISRASIDYIRYKVYEDDPQTIATELGGAGSMNLGNTAAVGVTKAMKQITLLYDIREELKQTNLLLGALGSMLSKQRYDQINGDINAVAQGLE